MDQGRGGHVKTVAEVAAEDRARLVAALVASVQALEPFKRPPEAEAGTDADAPAQGQSPTQSPQERRKAPREYMWERAGATEAVAAVCCALEDVLQYGQKREVGFLFGTKDYVEFLLLARGHVVSVRPAWDYVAGGELRHARTRPGRGRALLALALTKHFAQAALQYAAGCAGALREYYELWSVVRDDAAFPAVLAAVGLWDVDFSRSPAGQHFIEHTNFDAMNQKVSVASSAPSAPPSAEGSEGGAAAQAPDTPSGSGGGMLSFFQKNLSSLIEAPFVANAAPAPPPSPTPTVVPPKEVAVVEKEEHPAQEEKAGTATGTATGTEHQQETETQKLTTENNELQRQLAAMREKLARAESELAEERAVRKVLEEQKAELLRRADVLGAERDGWQARCAEQQQRAETTAAQLGAVREDAAARAHELRQQLDTVATESAQRGTELRTALAERDDARTQAAALTQQLDAANAERAQQDAALRAAQEARTALEARVHELEQRAGERDAAAVAAEARAKQLQHDVAEERSLRESSDVALRATLERYQEAADQLDNLAVRCRALERERDAAEQRAREAQAAAEQLQAATKKKKKSVFGSH